MANRYGNFPTVMVVGKSEALTVTSPLTHEGYHVIETSDLLAAFEEASDYTQACVPDLILLRVDMDAKRNLDSLDRLRQEGILTDVPVVFVSDADMTAKSTPLLAAEYSRRGATCVSNSGLRDAVKKIVKSHAAGV